MKPSSDPAFFPRVSPGLPFLAAAAMLCGGAARAQDPADLAEALDTPGVTWTSEGAVSAVTGPDLAHDGVDAVRLTPDSTGAGDPVVETVITRPSLVSFHHRSRDLDGTVIFQVTYNGASREVPATWWKKFGPVVVLPGEFRIGTEWGFGGNLLYLDGFSITPAPEVSLAEAADAPGVEFAVDYAESAAAVADAGLAPDGEDAIWFTRGVRASIPEGMVVGWSGTAHLRDAPLAGDRRDPRTRRVWYMSEGQAGTVSWSRTEDGAAVLDQVAVTPPVPLAEALDAAPGLVFESVGRSTAFPVFGTTEAPPGARGGHAAASWWNGARLRISGFQGPGVLRFHVFAITETESAWRTDEVAVPAGVTEYSWNGKGFWIDDVSFTPGLPDVAALLGQPGAAVSLPRPGEVAVLPASPPGEPGLRVDTWGEPNTVTELLRVSGEGPCLISLRSQESPQGFYADERRNDIAFQGTLYPVIPPAFAMVFPGPGPHRLSLTEPGLYRGLRVLPLVEVPLAEALDAPGMSFTTSPGAPWKGYVTGDALGAAGEHAACGGVHPDAPAGENPWLETTVEGPGILRFRSTRSALNGDDKLPATTLSVTLDGLPAPRHPLPAGPYYETYSDMYEIPIPRGAHTVRWTQPGADVTSAPGALVWLDQVFLTRDEAPPLSFGDALETGAGRAWSATGGADAAAPVRWPRGARDGEDCVLLREPGGGGDGETAALFTTVARPFVLLWKGDDVTVTVDGDSATPWGGLAEGWYHREGNGPPARVVFTAARPGHPGVLDTVAFFTELPAASAPGGSAGSSPSWALRGAGMSWLSNSDAPGADSGALFLPPFLPGSHYLEAVIQGPFSFPREIPLFLPDRGMRTARGHVTFPGPNRVILRPAGQDESLPPPARLPRITPGIPLGEATGAPDLPWETGGDVPWMGVAAQADGTPARAASGALVSGEHSWIQTEVEGPCVLRCRVDALPLSPFPATLQDYRITVNGAPVPPVTGVHGEYGTHQANLWLHLPPGRQRVRWWFSVFPDTESYQRAALLSHVAVEPGPAPSWREVTGLPDMPFVYSNTEWTPPAPWSSLRTWTAAQVDGRDAGRTILPWQMIPVLPGPGVYEITSLTRQWTPPYPGAPDAESAQAPHTWMPKSFPAPNCVIPHLYFLHPHGLEMLVDHAVWRPSAPVSLAEALDTPGMEWTVGSNGRGEWRGYADPPPAHGDADPAADPDAARFLPSDPGAEAWMETTVTGPARVEITWSDLDPSLPSFTSSFRELPDLRILLDGAEAVKGVSRYYASPEPVSVHVPPGTHTLRLHIGPLSGPKTAAEISRVTLTPEPGQTDIGELVDAPELLWTVANAQAAPVEPPGAWDGTDALRVTPAGADWAPVRAALNAAVRGPGVFRVRVNGSEFTLNGAPPLESWRGDYRVVETVIPPGPGTVSLQSYTEILVDDAGWRPLPALTAEEAAAALTPAPGATRAEAAAGTVYTGYPEGTPRGVLLLPGDPAGLRLRVPAFSRLTFSAEPLGDSRADLFAGLMWYPLSAEERREVRVATAALLPQDGWVTLRAEIAPLLISGLVITPHDGEYYLPWTEHAGLDAASGRPDADPDGDGVANLLEHAFGLDPRSADADGASLPKVSVEREDAAGPAYLTVRFRGRHGTASAPAAVTYSPVTYTVESADSDAGEEGALRWTAAPGILSPAPDPAAPGWADYRWRSAAPVSDGARRLVRVRATAR